MPYLLIAKNDGPVRLAGDVVEIRRWGTPIGQGREALHFWWIVIPAMKKLDLEWMLEMTIPGYYDENEKWVRPSGTRRWGVPEYVDLPPEAQQYFVPMVTVPPDIAWSVTFEVSDHPTNTNRQGNPSQVRTPNWNKNQVQNFLIDRLE